MHRDGLGAARVGRRMRRTAVIEVEYDAENGRPLTQEQIERVIEGYFGVRNVRVTVLSDD